MAWYIFKGTTYIPGYGAVASWTKIKNIYRKTTPANYPGTAASNFTDVSKEWRRHGGLYRKTSTGWRKVFTKTSTGVTFTTGPAIHIYSSPYPYGPNDGISLTGPRYINEVLYGKDGIWTPRNETSISRSFQAAATPDGANRFTIDSNDIFDLSSSTANQEQADESYLYYKISVQNYGDLVAASAGPVKLIKRESSFNSWNLTGTTTVGSTLSGTYSLENRWYNKPELYNSYIRWWRSSTTNPSGTLVREEYLGDHYSTNNSTSLQGSDSYTVQAADVGYYIVFQVVPYNSYNRHYGYETSSSYPSNIISSPITVSGVNFTDINGRSGKNALGNLVTSTQTSLNWTVGGVTSSTTFRVRYRVLNNQTGFYYNPSDPSTALPAGSAWQSYTKDYYGNGNISSISISGSTATLNDIFTISSTFNGSTYGGGSPRWTFQYEISVVNASGTRYYWNYGDSISTTQANDYWNIDPTTNPSISASSTSIATGGSVTFTGTFNPYPAGLSSYPQSYQIVYGDGYNSGWIALGGTANQSYSQSHTYSSSGYYSAYIQTTPSYTTNYAYVTVSSAPAIPTGLSGYANGNTASTQSFTLNWNASSGADTYELFFSGGYVPTDYQTYADFKGITAITYTTASIFSASSTYYWWVRAKNSSGAFSAWSPVVTITSNAQLLAAPTGVSATTTRTDGVNITWSAVSGASYYGIWYGGAPSLSNVPDFPNIYATSYLETGISAGSSRDYYVRAYTASGIGGYWSTVATGTRAVALAVPSTPTGLSASSNRTTDVYISWNAVSGATSYEIYWGGTPYDYYTPDFYPGSSTYYFDSGLSQGSYRTYYVRARNASGASSWSGGVVGFRSAPVVVVSAPATPTGVSISGSGLASWSASSGATSYTVEYYLASNSSGGNASGPYNGYPGSSTTYQVSYATVGGIYLNYARVRVLASNSGGNSSYSSYTGYA